MMLALNFNVPAVEEKVDLKNIPTFGVENLNYNCRPQYGITSIEIDSLPEQLGEIVGDIDPQSLANFRDKQYLANLNAFLTTIQESGLPKPEIVGNIKDLISFEWRSSEGDEFVVTLKPDSSLIYSGVFGEGNVFGTEKFAGKKIPTSISVNILRSI
ncbi:MAG: hypothetical protein ACXVCN_18915 [Bdellovibrio sp.]